MVKRRRERSEPNVIRALARGGFMPLALCPVAARWLAGDSLEAESERSGVSIGTEPGAVAAGVLAFGKVVMILVAITSPGWLALCSR